jgi:hypothetical protein
VLAQMEGRLDSTAARAPAGDDIRDDAGEQGAGSPIARIASSLEISTSILSKLTFPGAGLIRLSTSSSCRRRR